MRFFLGIEQHMVADEEAEDEEELSAAPVITKFDIKHFGVTKKTRKRQRMLAKAIKNNKKRREGVRNKEPTVSHPSPPLHAPCRPPDPRSARSLSLARARPLPRAPPAERALSVAGAVHGAGDDQRPAGLH